MDFFVERYKNADCFFVCFIQTNVSKRHLSQLDVKNLKGNIAACIIR